MMSITLRGAGHQVNIAPQAVSYWGWGWDCHVSLNSNIEAAITSITLLGAMHQVNIAPRLCHTGDCGVAVRSV